MSAVESFEETVTTQVSHALALASEHDSTHVLQDIAIECVLALEPRATFERTGYFNHTVVPDFSVSWKDSATRARPVYVRMSRDLGSFRHMIPEVHRREALVVDLMPAPGFGEQEDIRRLATERDQLVLDPPAAKNLSAQLGKASFAGLLAPAMARGGRGLLDADRAKKRIAGFSKGFESAERGLPAETRQLADSLDEILDGVRRASVQNVLQAIWAVGAGGQEPFPGQAEVSSGIGDSELKWLLTLDDLADEALWHRIGTTTNLEQLARVAPDNYSAALGSLVRSGAHLLASKAAGVTSRPDELEQDPAAQGWFALGGCLAFDASATRAFFGPSVDTVRQRLGTSHDLVKLEDLAKSRASKHFTSVNVKSAKFDFRVQGRKDRDVPSVAGIEELLDELRDDTVVETATLAIPGGGSLNLDFASRSASVVANTRATIADYFDAAIEILGADDEAFVAVAAGLAGEIASAFDVQRELELSPGAGSDGGKQDSGDLPVDSFTTGLETTE